MLLRVIVVYVDQQVVLSQILCELNVFLYVISHERIYSKLHNLTVLQDLIDDLFVLRESVQVFVLNEVVLLAKVDLRLLKLFIFQEVFNLDTPAQS